MQLPAFLLRLSNKCGGPWNFLLLNIRGGQLTSAIVSLGVFAYLISLVRSHHHSTPAAFIAVETLSAFLILFVPAVMLATWFRSQSAWFGLGSMAGDIAGLAASIAIAVLTRESSLNCGGSFRKQEEVFLGTSHVKTACKLQKIVFATGVTNLLMFIATFCVQAYLISRRNRKGSDVEKVDATAQREAGPGK